MTVKHVKAVSVPPVMSRSSVTAAAAVKNRQSAKNTVMHMRGLIITDFPCYKIPEACQERILLAGFSAYGGSP